MKKLLIAFSMVGAVALIASATDNSVTPNYASAAWFSAAASGTAISTTGGNFSAKQGTASTYEAKAGKIEFDSELADPVSFVVSAAKTTTLSRVVFNLDAAIVPVAARPTDLTGVKTAFALVKDGTSTNFQAWTAIDGTATNGWQTLNLTNIPSEDQAYTLTMKFNDSELTNKVQFTVQVGEGEAQTTDWLAYSGLSEKPTVDFVGTGRFTSFNADQVWITSSTIVIPGGGSVTIDKKDEAAMNKLIGGDGSLEAALAKPVSGKVSGINSSCGLNVAEAYAIGLIAKKSGADEMVAKADGTFKMKADATAKVDNGIAIKFVDELTPADPEVTITYSLLGQKTADGKWMKIEEAQDKESLAEVAIPISAVTDGYRYFKVVTKVQLPPAAN